MSDNDAEDNRLLVDLAAAVGPDPVPADLVAICRGLSVWADVDAELAELLDADVAELAGVRNAATADAVRREFHLDGGSVVVEVEVTDTEISGFVLPAPVGAVRLESSGGGSTDAELDAVGRFSFARPDGGVVRLRLQGPDGPVVTDWFTP